MNLRVNLILASEQRSGSAVSFKSIIKIGRIVLPIIAVVAVASSIMNMARLKSELTMAEAEWDDVKPRQEAALKLRAQLAASKAILDQLEAWRKTRVNWRQTLRDVQERVPPTIQFRTLTVAHSVVLPEKSKTAARMFALTVEGRAVGDQAEGSVQDLRDRLLHGAAFTGMIDRVEIQDFSADTSDGAGKSDRVFKLRCVFAARKFE